MSKVRIVVVLIALGFLGGLPHRAPTAARTRSVTPRLEATLEIGGTSGEALFGNIDADGRPDVVTLRGGRVVVVSTDGRTLFDRFVGATGLVDVADLDLDGHDDVVVLNGPGRTIAAVDPFGQAISWQYTFSDAVSLDAAYVRVADLSSARPGLETVAFPDHSHTLGDAKGVFIDATGAVFATPVVRSETGNQLNFPQLAIGNVDSIGDPEVVVVGRPRLLVYRSDGSLVSEAAFHAGDPEGRHYGTIQLANLDADAELEAVVISDRVAQVTADKAHAIVVFDLAPAVREKWRIVAPSGHLLESIPNGVVDVDGDAMEDVSVNHFDGRTQAIEIYRGAGDSARPGQALLLARLEGTYAWDTWTRNPTTPLFFASLDRVAQPSISYKSQLVQIGVERLASGAGIQLVRRSSPVTARYATRPLRALGRDVATSSLGGDRTGVVAAMLPKGPAFVTYTLSPDGTPQIQFRLFGATPTVIDRGARSGTVRAIDESGYVLVAGAIGEETSDALQIYRWNPATDAPAVVGSFRAAGFGAQAPVAFDVDGDGSLELAVRTAGKRVVVYGRTVPGGAYAQRWSVASTTQPVVDTPRSPSERPRLFVIAPTQRDRAKLVALDGSGKTLWEARFRDLPASSKPEILIGEFTGKPPRDVWVSAPRSKSWVVDGADGRIVWESTKIFSFSNRSAIADANADGIDDIVAVGNFTYGVYSGRDAKPIVGPVDVRKLDGDLFATPLLAGDGTVALVSSSRLAKARIGGKPDWMVERTVGRTNATLLPGLARLAGDVVAIGGNFGASDRFVAYDYDEGRPVFSTRYIPVTHVITADTDGDGGDEFIFGTSDGRVVAIHAQSGAEVWAVDVGAFASTPSIERLSSAGLSLIVPLEDGTIRLYSLS